MTKCKAINCNNGVAHGVDFCTECVGKAVRTARMNMGTTDEVMSVKYPKYYKSVEHLTEVDVYSIHHLFGINDPSGAIQHASKKLLLSGARTGGKSAYQDIQEAKDTLTRWLQLNESSQ